VILPYAASRIMAGIDFRAKNIESLENLEKNSMDFYASSEKFIFTR
jgi:phospholipid-binding lipoprotein MlaA